MNSSRLRRTPERDRTDDQPPSTMSQFWLNASMSDSLEKPQVVGSPVETATSRIIPIPLSWWPTGQPDWRLDMDADRSDTAT